MLTWDQCDLNWNMWLNGFLKNSCACKSLQKLKSFREREGWVRRVLLWTGIVPLTLFTEMTEKRMNFVADGMGNGIWGNKVISRKQSERWRPHRDGNSMCRSEGQKVKQGRRSTNERAPDLPDLRPLLWEPTENTPQGHFSLERMGYKWIHQLLSQAWGVSVCTEWGPTTSHIHHH